MISIPIYLLLILCVSFPISIKTKRKVVEVLPCSLTVIVGILFLFGLAGWLIVGVVLIIICAMVSIALGMHIVRKEKDIKAVFPYFDGVVCFLIIAIVFTFVLKGKLFDQWDEFSHWGDVVKATVDLNGFSTNPESMCAFQSYPPGMVIFQYLLQKIHIMTGGSFSEWRCYFSYNMFLLCFMMPAISKMTSQKPIISIVSIISTILLPSVFYPKTYYSLYIDVAVSCVFAYGLYSVVKEEKNETFRLLSICATCFVLPLLKDVGLFFSIVLLVCYCIRKQSWKRIGIVILSLSVPTVLWKINVKITRASEVFPFKYDFNELWRVINGAGEEYRQIVLKEFPRVFLSQKYTLGDTNIAISFISLITIVSVGSFFAIKQYVADTHSSTKTGSISLTILATMITYALGLYLSYMFQFSEYESINFASFTRYMYIPICGICLFSLYIRVGAKKQGQVFILLCIILFFAPMGNIYELVDGEIVLQSRQTREKYIELTDKVQKNTDGNSAVYLISQQDDGGDFWVFHYLFRPNKMIIGQLSSLTGFEAGGYSIGKPYYEGDIWSSDVTPEELMDEWVARYDYVAVYRTNEYLKINFKSLFDAEVADNSLWKIDKELRHARLVE